MAFVPPPPPASSSTFMRNRAQSEAFARRNLILEESDQASVSTISHLSNPFATANAMPSNLPAWFETGFVELDGYNAGQASSSALPLTSSSPINRSSSYAPELYVAETEHHVLPQLHEDAEQQDDLLDRYDHGGTTVDVHRWGDEPHVSTSKRTGSKVTIKRVIKGPTQAVTDARREITILSSVRDQSLPVLVEWLELRDAIWTVLEHQTYRTLREMVDNNKSLATTTTMNEEHEKRGAKTGGGPFSESMTKTAINQLFSAIASLFMAGFAHLRISPDTVCVCLDESSGSGPKIVIRDLHYACAYGKEVVGDFYAPTREKHLGFSDVFVAPEIFAHSLYNARKATIWSCGVLIYYITTGQTEKLSNLDHPAFEKTIPDNIHVTNDNDNDNYRYNQSVPTHHRRISVANAKSKIIMYPDRFAAPNYCRAIIPRMLVQDPKKRAELIEVATRVPKEYHSTATSAGNNNRRNSSQAAGLHSKSTRPLMELAWLDYKTHVGPYAGLDVGAGTGGGGNTSISSSIFGGGDGGGPGRRFSSAASSIISAAASNFSNPFESLLGRKGGKDKRRQSAPPGVWS